MTVSVLPKSNGLKDEAQNRIVPLTLSGLPEELDAGFIGAISNPSKFRTPDQHGGVRGAGGQGCRRQQGGEGSESQGDEGGEREAREVREAHEEGGGTDCSQEAQGCHRHTLGQAKLYATEQNKKTVEEKIEEQKKAMSQGSLFDLMDEGRATAATCT